MVVLHLLVAVVPWPREADDEEPTLPSARGARVGLAWLLITGGSVLIFLFAWHVAGSARTREYHNMLKRLAEALGLTYSQDSPLGRLDRFRWELSGKFHGREAQIARVPRGVLRGEPPLVQATVVTMSCGPSKRLWAFIGSPWDHPGEPSHAFSQPYLADVRAWVEEGEFDPEPFGRLPIMELLAMGRMRRAALEIKGERVRLFYELDSPVLSYHPRFVERALKAMSELAELVEQAGGSR